jgi:hypothetical protein
VEEGFGDCQSFLVRYGVKCGFSGLLVAAEPGKMRTITQKIRRLVLRMLYCVVAEEFWAHAFLKSTSTDFGGGGLVQAVLERPCERW